MIEAVIFDMDGLIIDSEPFWQESESKVFSSLGVQTSAHLFETFMGKRIDEVVDLMWQQQPWNIKSKSEVVEEIVSHVITLVKTHGKAMTGLFSILELLHQHPVKIALASSSKMKIIDAVLDHLKIRKYFEVIHSAEYEEYGKPHPQIFISTANMLGVSPHNCLVLEDSLNGVISALAANMKCFAIPNIHANNLEKFVIANRVLQSLNDFSLKDLQSL